MLTADEIILIETIAGITITLNDNIDNSISISDPKYFGNETSKSSFIGFTATKHNNIDIDDAIDLIKQSYKKINV